MSVTKIVPLTNVGLLAGAIKRAQARPVGLPGLVAMYGPSGFGKSVAAAYSANLHRAYYVECRDAWSKKAFLLAILREMSIFPAKTMSEMVDQIAVQLSASMRPLIVDDVQYLLDKAVANALTDIYNASQGTIVLIGEERAAEQYKASIGGKKGNVSLLTFDGRYKVIHAVSGYGITDAFTKIETTQALLGKANKATTLEGYGIADAFTKPETTVAIDRALAALVDSSLGGDQNFSATMTKALAAKAPLADPKFTGIPTAPTATAGTSSDQVATTKFVAALIAALDPWAMQPIGVPIPVMAGAGEPPTNKAYRYIKLTYGDPYNSGVLTGEVVTGVAPIVVSYARISVAGSPISGNTVYLINTERRSIRPGAAGSLQDDAIQNITGKLATGLPTFGSVSVEGVFGFSPPPGSSQTGVTGGGANGLIDLTFDASKGARTSNETRTKNIGANFYMRVL